MRSTYRGLLALSLCCSVLAASPAAMADVTIKWQNSASPTDTDSLLADYLVNSNIITDFVQLVQENFRFDPEFVLVIGSEDGPEFAKEGRVLRVPYRYLGRAVETQAELVEKGEVAIDRALNVVEYTLYHLLGHALLNESSVDVDDKAEALATWIMVSNWPNGGEQWLENIRAFGDASQKLDGPLEDFWHTHSLYKSRQSEIECWVLGHNPELIEPLLPVILDAAKRREKCVASWNELHEASMQTLEPMLSDEAPLRILQQ